MAQAGMPMLFRLGNSIAASSCDFVKHNYSSNFYQDDTIKQYILLMLKQGFSFDYLYQDFRFYNLFMYYNKFKIFTELLMCNFCLGIITFDSETIFEVDSCAKFTEIDLLTTQIFNIWVLKCEDWLIFTCYLFNDNSIFYNNIAVFDRFLYNYFKIQSEFFFCEEASFFITI